ncbi:hypothetical protein FRC02_000295 [Tulasnella sp. 418]|nr:hypothetical protein FRC02_000295 [Tulasnella sp. 418]
MAIMSGSKLTSGPTFAAANAFLSFVNASPTPYHAVSTASQLLDKAGFKRVDEGSDWEQHLQEGARIYYTRNQSSLLAFTVPKGFKQGAGVSIVATHTDSPNLRVRPISKRSKVGYMQVGVETYGGGIWHSWFDRDLGLAGRIVVASSGVSSSSDDNKTVGSAKYNSRLIRIDRPLLRIPTLAIHLERGVNDAFKFNNETEFIPILGQMAGQLNSRAFTKDNDSDKDKKVAGPSAIQDNHHPALLALLAEEMSVAPEEIMDFELMLYDLQPSQLGGINNEFIFSPRMDNLVSTFCAVEALIESVSENSVSELEGNVNCIALFNHEEVGSVSTSGAQSSLVPNFISRLSPTPASHASSISKSFLISADMGHAVHPNYTSKHEENHRPQMNGGVVIKTNASQRYASDAWGSFIVRKLIERRGGRVQEFEVRNDMCVPLALHT